MTKRAKTIIAAIAVSAVALSAAAASAVALSPLSVQELVISRDAVYQTLKGFGVSGAWWAQGLTDETFSKKVAEALFSENSLNLNLYRYNVGAGEKSASKRRVYSDRATESFYYFNESTKKYEYDFTRDAAAYAFLLNALDGTLKEVVLFANSPHYSMTVSGSASGNDRAYTLNLKADSFDDFAEYLTKIAAYFIENGIPVSYISPLNEPQWSWGGENVSQEGCHYEPAHVAELGKILYEYLKMNDVNAKISLFESGSLALKDVKPYLSALSREEAFKNSDHVSLHSYWADGNIRVRKKLRKYLDRTVPDKEVHMTEWCELPSEHSSDDIDSAIILSRTLSNDLNYLNAVTWYAWKGYEEVPPGIVGSPENRTDSLLYGVQATGELYAAKRYYALMHYSAFWEPGSVRVGAKIGKGIASAQNEKNLPVTAFVTPSGKTVAVITNTTSVSKSVSLGAETGRSVNIYVTDKERNTEKVFSGGAPETLDIAAKSIVTLVIE